MKYILSIIILIYCILFIYGCATVTQPTGGPRDVKPPEMQTSYPENGQLNYKGKTIEITFDENVDLVNHQKEILVTPSLSEDIDGIYKKNKVIITLNEELQENTTYTFNFRESIRDLTEKNAATDLKIAFSTGDFIDSSYIEGKVYNLLTAKPVPEVLIGLYYADDTLNIINKAPIYLAYSKKDGTYRFDNIRAGQYKIYAVSDKNKNSIVDFKNELYGFESEILQLDTGLINVDIPMVYNDLRPLKLQSARAAGKYYNIKYNKYVYDYKIKSEPFVYSTFEEDHATLKLYNDSSFTDSLKIIIETTDSTFYTYTDSLYLKFAKSPRGYTEYSFTIAQQKINKKINKYEGVINFNKPSFFLNKDSIFYTIDTLIRVPYDSFTFKWNLNRTQLNYAVNINSYLTDSSDLTLNNFQIAPQSFISIDKDTSTTGMAKPVFYTSEQTGTIEYTINTEVPHFIVQLLDNKYTVLQQQFENKKGDFRTLDPGNYMLRIIIDENGNGRWDPGDIIKNIKPEPVVYYKDEEEKPVIILKANWINDSPNITYPPVDNPVDM